MLRLLEGMGKQHLERPEELKFLLCPLLAQTPAEQERFYELFDQYWKEITQPWEWPELPAEPPPKKKKQQIPDWLPWVLTAGLLLGMGWIVDNLLDQPPAPKVLIRHVSETPNRAVLGDSLHFENATENPDTTGYFIWEVVDDRTGKVEYRDSVPGDFHFRLDSLGGSAYKRVRVWHFNWKRWLRGADSLDLRVNCVQLPKVTLTAEKRDLKAGESTTFLANLEDTTGVTLQWEMGDGSDPQIGQLTREHTFTRTGQFDVRVKATRTGLDGFCEAEAKLRVNVGRELAYLEAKPLFKDPVLPTVHVAWAFWLLWGVLGLAAGWFWWRWFRRKPPEPEPVDEQAELAQASETFAAPDRGPYFIPFQARDGYIRVKRGLYRFADILRQRQVGLRQELDIPRSVKKTIASGGFPHLLTDTDTVPTEYLFLLDGRSRNSHQGRLMEFLVKFLKKREVLGEIFYFNQRLHSFWNQHYPEGLSGEKLARLYARHRIIVLSDGHAFLDPESSSGQPSLRPEAKKMFARWKNRLLLTPLPLVSWTWREGVLHRHFPIFPSHTEGLGEALKFLQQDMQDDDAQPTYANWCERLRKTANGVSASQNRAPEPDVNYRRWRTAADHEDYLREHPGLFTWLQAIAVYPKPVWNLTLAIGHALGEHEVDVNYDNLLILSRIPWLVSGDLPPKLRRSLLVGIDPEVEKLARKAVTDELAAVEEKIAGSHANREWQMEQALQNFAIDPTDGENQKRIQQLLSLNLLTPRQLMDLNQRVYPASRDRSKTTVQNYLDGKQPEPEAQEAPFLTPDFYRATLASILLLVLLLLAGMYNGTEQLGQAIGQSVSATTDCDPKPLFANLLEQRCSADSAVLLNNEGVDHWRQMQKLRVNQERSITNRFRDAKGDFVSVSESLFERERALAVSKFEKALVYNSDYALAQSNLLKLKYNSGERIYRAYLNDTLSVGALAQAMLHFRAAQADSLELDALHGQGLVHFYQWQEASIGSRSDKAPQIRDLQAQISRQRLQLKNLVAALERAEITQRNYSQQRAKLEDLGQDLSTQLAALQNDAQPSPDSAQLVYAEIISQNRNYFDSLATYPHLQSLLGSFFDSVGPPPTVQIAVTVLDAQRRQPLPEVQVLSEGTLLSTDAEGRLMLEMTTGQRSQFEFSRNGYLPKRQEVRAGLESSGLTVLLEPVPQEPQLASNASVLYFDADQASLRPDARLALDSIAGQLAGNPAWGLTITGHTDTEGTEAYNLQISERMVKAVVDYLENRGIDPQRLTSRAMGESQARPGASAAANRRVELTLNLPLAPDGIADDDGDGVPNSEDECPDEVGTIENNGCLPAQVPTPVTPEVAIEFQEIKAHFVAEPRILKNKDFFDTLNYDGKVFRIVLNGFFENGILAQFTVEKMSQPGVSAEQAELPVLAAGEKHEFDMDGKRFSFQYLGQDRLKVNRLLRDVARYSLSLQVPTVGAMDSDGDGVPNERDACPDFSGTLNGCPDDAIVGIVTDEDGEFIPVRIGEVIIAPIVEIMETGESTKISREGKFQLSYTPQRGEVYELKVSFLNYETAIVQAEIGRQVQISLREPDPLHPSVLTLENDMVLVQGGTFEMGCDKKYDGDCEDDELPLHEVRLDDFSIGKYEVTQELWEAVMGNNPSNFNGCPKCPVEEVSWNDVQEFLEKLNQLLPGRNFRLPTEAEWEYAARGGPRGKRRYRYAGSNDLDEVGWYTGNSDRETHPVGQKGANELGLYDMSGNVWEWCSDRYGKGYYGQFVEQVADNPEGAENGSGRVLRGGAWLSNVIYCRVACRLNYIPNLRYNYTGFRLAQGY